jgi:hypothetical protein
MALGEPAAAGQLLGVAAVLAGIVMSTKAPKPAGAPTPVADRWGRLAIADRASRVLLAFRSH